MNSVIKRCTVPSSVRHIFNEGENWIGKYSRDHLLLLLLFCYGFNVFMQMYEWFVCAEHMGRCHVVVKARTQIHCSARAHCTVTHTLTSKSAQHICPHPMRMDVYNTYNTYTYTYDSRRCALC